MAKLGGTVEEGEPRSGRGRHLRDAIKPGRWIVLLLGILATLVLSGYLITDHLATPTAATDKSSFSSMTDILKAALGAAVALAWAVFGAWLGRRRARRPKYLDEPADDMRATDYPSRTPYDSGRAPTCERMYDETRLVPQYLRSAEFRRRSAT